MQVPFVDLKIQYDTIKPHIDKALMNVLSEGRFIGGKAVEKFEQDLASYIGCKHVISCANGTDALEVALFALGVGIGDEVIVPATSWVSTASAVHTVGAVPVFVDVLPDSFTIDPSKIEEVITERTQAIIPVHLYGQMADMKAISEIAAKNNLFVLEDAAQAIGSKQNGDEIGKYSDIATLSFYPGKNLGAYGDGGAVFTNETVMANSCRIFGGLGQKEPHNHVTLGRNSRLDTMQAAVLSVKLKVLDKWNQRRNSIAKVYDSLLSNLPIQLPQINEGNYSNYHLYVIEVANRNHVLNEMEKAGVTCQLHYPKALPDLLPFKSSSKGKFPVARNHAESCLSLPMYPEMTKEQIEFVAKSLHEALV